MSPFTATARGSTVAEVVTIVVGSGNWLARFGLKHLTCALAVTGRSVVKVKAARAGATE
jgi:hypothetical protein